MSIPNLSVVTPVAAEIGLTTEPDSDLIAFANRSIDFAYDCETLAYDGHTDDLLDPIHGTDLDPCAVCDPEAFDLATASLYDFLAAQRDPADVAPTLVAVTDASVA